MPKRNRKMPKAKKRGIRKSAPKKGAQKSASASAAVAANFPAPVPTGTVSPNNAAVITDGSGDEHGLGHVYTYDAGDFEHPMSPHVGEIDGDPMTQTQVHALGPILNQQKTQSCVGHGWTLFVTSAPQLTSPGPNPYRIYHEAQQLDDIAGEEPVYFGTTVRAGAKAMLQDGWITGDYVWAEDARVLWKYVLTRGPVVLGSDWFEGMNRVDNNGFVTLSGARVGGHCYLCYGVSASDRAFLCANSWGKTWGDGGIFLFRFDDARTLFWRQQMVACSAVESG